MLLAIDAGNSDIKLGLFDGPKLLRVKRLPRNEIRFDDEYFAEMERFAEGPNGQEVTAVITSWVTDAIMRKWLPDKISKLKPVRVKHTMNTGLKILYDEPSLLGTDRLVDAVAAVEKYGAPCIVVDFGTATTFNAISAEREFLGGIIVPGILTGFKSLVASTAKLGLVDFMLPYHVIGRSTEDSLKSGLFFGTIDLVDGLLKRIREEMGGSPRVIATGGLAQLLEYRSEYIEIFDETLTLDGLRIVYEMNKA